MKLDEAFNGSLTSDTVGLQPLIGAIIVMGNQIKNFTQEGKLVQLKKAINELHTDTKRLIELINKTKERMTDIAETEDGNIIDLSLPPSKR